MRVFAIGDPHLSFAKPKPMSIFGSQWDHHEERLQESWKQTVREEDVVLIPGDISWAMHMEDAIPDLEFLAQCPGKKVILRGNHDYWWDSVSKVRAILPPNMYAIQNDCLRIDRLLVAGTRGWTCPGSSVFNEERDRKIYEREVGRLALSLQAMKPNENDVCIGMLHYPPINEHHQPSGFSEQFANSSAKIVVYGHLHGKSCQAAFEEERNGQLYRLVSCDYLNFKPLLLMDMDKTIV